MLSELYLYAFPKVLKDKPSQFKIWHVLILILSGSVLLVESMIVGITIMSATSVLYLLCFAEKNAVIRHMKMVVVFALTFAAMAVNIALIIAPEARVVLTSIIGCIFICVIYEIVIFIKIKKRLYSIQTNTNQKDCAIGASSGLIVYFINKLLLKNQNIVAIVIIMISSFAMLCVVISIQKLVVYLLTRNKIQIDCNDGKEI